MRIPQSPPKFAELLGNITPERFLEISSKKMRTAWEAQYVHWDKLRRYPTPDGFSHRDWWMALKFERLGSLRPVPLLDKIGENFRFAIPGLVILNNYATMQWVRSLKAEPLTAEMIFEMHRKVTRGTLDNDDAAGRLRNEVEAVCVRDDFGVVFHEPPPARELPDRLTLMCDFANGKSPDFFIHPVIRAIILHFWLAYDHPFVDGNGRTARALFYWSMMRSGYWLFEFISISNILRKAPAKYARSFLYTETDENDLTYFIVAQTRVIRQAIVELHAYIDRKTREVQQLEHHIKALQLFNHRQVELVRHALKHPFSQYTIASHQKNHGIVYQTARGDLLVLARRGVLDQKMRGRELLFTVPADMEQRLRLLESQLAPGEKPVEPLETASFPFAGD